MGILDKLRAYDRYWFGLILGVLLPLILYPILRPLDPKNFEFIAVSYNEALLKMIPMLLSRCIFPSALLFFLLIWSDFDKTAKGVLHTTVILTAILILIQIIF